MKWSEAIVFILKDLDWWSAAIVAIVVAFLSFRRRISADHRASITLLVLGTMAIGALRNRYSTEAFQAVVDDLKTTQLALLHGEGLLADHARTGIDRVLPATVDFDWLKEMESATNITIAKLRLNVTDDPRYFESLERVLSKGGSVTLVMADPRAPAMWVRYREEPNPLWHTPDKLAQSTAWMSGLEELAGQARRLKDWKDGLKGRGIDTRKLTIGVSPYYPSHAFYIFDDRIYVYSYPFGERGFHGPAYLYTNPKTDTHSFLLRCANDIVLTATPLDAAIDDIWKRYKAGDLSDAKVAKSVLRVTPAVDGPADTQDP